MKNVISSDRSSLIRGNSILSIIAAEVFHDIVVEIAYFPNQQGGHRQ
ncbi:TPA: hypothetical protein KKX73_002377 [Legionella pneumophila]|nr:hypothetical protein [Legionella pneumophila]HBD7503593.1 hypothetical protein [Legionella pneumophila]HBD9218157.1 hypothetical protein [Legionella pneumophila]